MKLSLSNIDLPEETLQAFAIFVGWTEQSEKSFSDFLKEKYRRHILKDIKEFNLQEAKDTANMKIYEASKIMLKAQEEANKIIGDAEVIAEETANSMIGILKK